MLGIMLIYFASAILGVLAVLLVHELGHLTAARYCGVQVLRIKAGLGPEVTGLTDRHGTRWSLGVFPLGASVMMFDRSNSEADLNTADMLSSKSLFQRAAIYAAGPVFSLLLALAMLSIVSFFEGTAAKSFERPAVLIATLLGHFSLLVAGFQMMPILPLDGGWLVILAGEALTGKVISERCRKLLRLVGLAVIIAAEISVTVAAVHLAWTTLAR